MEKDMAAIKSSSHRSTNKRVFQVITKEDITEKKVLDIGAGRGYMSRLLGEHVRKKGKRPSEVVTACDLFPEYFSYDGVACERMEFINAFPFDDNAFDVAYAVEVIEHLKCPYDFIQEMYRVVKPGGRVIITTPNILNLTSRISFVLTGFFELFKPLSFDAEDARRQWGHIMPLSAYYLDHAMKACGFKEVDLKVDRVKKSSLFLLLLLFPALRISSLMHAKRLLKKKPAVYKPNEQALKAINGWKLCCSRSAILVGYK